MCGVVIGVVLGKAGGRGQGRDQSVEGHGGEAKATNYLGDFNGSSNCDCGANGQLLIIFSVLSSSSIWSRVRRG